MSPHRAALILTTPNHPYSYFVYGAQAFLGVLLIVGVITVTALAELILLPVAGAIMAAGGFTALYSISATPVTLHKDPPLRLEQIAAWVIGGTNTLFGAALFAFYGWDLRVPLKVYVVGLAAACIYRAVQIRRQRYRLRQALADLAPASPTLAARPDPDT